MTEINLTPSQSLLLILVLLAVAIYLWHKISYFQLDIEPKKNTESNYTPKLTNDRYGAYIQLAGRKYN